jgi:hypothetical protein
VIRAHFDPPPGISLEQFAEKMRRNGWPEAQVL